MHGAKLAKTSNTRFTKQSVSKRANLRKEITIFFLIDLNKIRLKNVPAPKVAKLTISKWAFFLKMFWGFWNKNHFVL